MSNYMLIRGTVAKDQGSTVICGFRLPGRPESRRPRVTSNQKAVTVGKTATLSEGR